MSSLLHPDLRAEAAELVHPWLVEARNADLPPGKRLHVEALANVHVYHGRSRRRRVADLLYPLMAQPVLELCLAIPTYDLAGGSYDRPFAREAFAARIPEEVQRRRSKGMTTSFVSKLVASSAPMLRTFLLDGCLMSAGLLDRAAVEAATDPNQLIWRGAASDVLWAAATEAWVRHWQTRCPDSETVGRR